MEQSFLSLEWLFLTFASSYQFLKPFSVLTVGISFLWWNLSQPFCTYFGVAHHKLESRFPFYQLSQLFWTQNESYSLNQEGNVSCLKNLLLILWLKREKDNLIKETSPGKGNHTIPCEISVWSTHTYKSFWGSLIWPGAYPSSKRDKGLFSRWIHPDLPCTSHRVLGKEDSTLFEDAMTVQVSNM